MRLKYSNNPKYNTTLTILAMVFVISYFAYKFNSSSFEYRSKAKTEIPLKSSYDPSWNDMFQTYNIADSSLPFSQNDSLYFVKVDEPAKPVGGIASILNRIEYPAIALRLRYERTVLIEAHIDKEGYVTNAKVLKGIGAGCDEDALQAVLASTFHRVNILVKL